MSVLSAEFHSGLSQLLKGLQAADNVERTAAEEQLNQIVADNPNQVLMGLAEQIQLAQDTSVSIAPSCPG